MAQHYHRTNSMTARDLALSSGACLLLLVISKTNCICICRYRIEYNRNREHAREARVSCKYWNRLTATTADIHCAIHIGFIIPLCKLVLHKFVVAFAVSLCFGRKLNWTVSNRAAPLKYVVKFRCSTFWNMNTIRWRGPINRLAKLQLRVPNKARHQ